jgi:hypothetical protein
MIAHQLKDAAWGEITGPHAVNDLPEELREAARWVQEVGDKLAYLRALYTEGVTDPLLLKLHRIDVVTEALLTLVRVPHGEGPSDELLWHRDAIDPESADAREAAIRFYGIGGQPAWDTTADHSPAAQDIRAIQAMCRQLHSAGYEPGAASNLLDAFAFEHWVLDQGMPMLSNDWELTPLGRNILQAVGNTGNEIPSEEIVHPRASAILRGI